MRGDRGEISGRSGEEREEEDKRVSDTKQEGGGPGTEVLSSKGIWPTLF